MNIDKLMEILKEKAESHRQYYHYTSLSNAKSIVNDEYLLCTNAVSENLSDQHESFTYGARKNQEKIYYASFTFGSSENIALWHMYAGEEYDKGVRIGIPRTSMRTWILDGAPLIYLYDDNTGIGKQVQERNIHSVYISDVLYFDQENQCKVSIKLANDENKTKTISPRVNIHASEISGIGKNDAWKFENETRIIIELKKKISSTRLAIKLPEQIIATMKITSNPWFPLENANDSLSSEIKKIQGTEKSIFFNRVKAPPHSP